MESRSLKPSGLKKPMTITKAILPMDRIKPTISSGYSHKIQQCTSVNSSIIAQPLKRGLSNIQEFALKRGRAPSPETQRPRVLNQQTKLRRSRSACDISDMRSLKQVDNALQSTAPKRTRLTPTISGTCNNGVNKAQLYSVGHTSIPQKNISKSLASAPSTKIAVVRAARNTSQNPGGKKQTATIASSTSSAGGEKPASKRIPPYDFKARYKDLFEKHTALKEKLERKMELLSNLENIPELLEETQGQLITAQEELKNTQRLNECLQRQTKMQQEKLGFLTDNLVKTTEEFENLTKIYNNITKHTANTAKKSKTDRCDELLEFAVNKFNTREKKVSNPITEFWAVKLERIAPQQRILCEKFIDDILFEGQMGTLHRNSVQINRMVIKPIPSSTFKLVSCTPTPSPSITPTPSLSITSTPTPSFTSKPTPTPSFTSTPTPTPSPSFTSTPTPSNLSPDCNISSQSELFNFYSSFTDE